MKVSTQWMQQVSNVDLMKDGIESLVDKIGKQLGAVEETIGIGHRYEGIVVVRVMSCEPHPNADKLKVCLVDDGGVVKDVKRTEQDWVQVVCGAPNVRKGMLAAWIPPGAVVPASFDREPLKLDAREIRGVISNGMLASAHELGISDDHTGIIEIDEKASLGQSFLNVYNLDDYIIDIENKMFTHRPDCFGQLGVAREIAGIQGLAFTSPSWYTEKPTIVYPANKTLPLEVRNELPELVKRFAALPIANVNVKPSPLWLQTYLSRVGVRPINNVVDITNYLMLLTGQPLHAYDYDKVKAEGGSSEQVTLVIRHPHKDERLTLLGGKVVQPHAKAIIIATDRTAIGLGGIMGGADTEVDENTTNIILECATFDMYNIRRSAMEHGLFTDAVTRFTKGQSPLQNDRIIARAGQLLQELTGGVIAGKLIDDQHDLPDTPTLRVKPEFVNERLGTHLKLDDMAQLLKNVEFDVSADKELVVRPPFWRMDIHIPEDLVEEIGRLYGYEHLPLTLPGRDLTPAATNPLLAFKDRLRRSLRQAGANEVLTYSFVHGSLMEGVGQDPKGAFQIANALSPDLQYYRVSLLPSLLEKVHPNIKAGFDEFALFEINQTHSRDLRDKDGLPIEEYRLGLVFAAGDKTARAKYTGAPYYQAKRYVEALLADLGIDPVFHPATDYQPTMQVSQQAIAPLDKQRSALIKTRSGQFIGELGEFSGRTRRNLKLPAFVAGFELDVMQLMKLAGQKPLYVPLPRFPKVLQDITVRVPDGVTYQVLHDFLLDTLTALKPKQTVMALEPLDMYQQPGRQERHITFRLSIASYERTLVSEEVNNLLDSAAAAAKSKLGTERI